MTKEELYQLIGHQDIQKDLDVKTLVLDLIRFKFTQEEVMDIFWGYLNNLDEEFIRGYFYRKFS